MWSIACTYINVYCRQIKNGSICTCEQQSFNVYMYTVEVIMKPSIYLVMNISPCLSISLQSFMFSSIVKQVMWCMYTCSNPLLEPSTILSNESKVSYLNDTSGAFDEVRTHTWPITSAQFQCECLSKYVNQPGLEFIFKD